jgi:hypothetical protein
MSPNDMVFPNEGDVHPRRVKKQFSYGAVFNALAIVVSALLLSTRPSPSSPPYVTK